MDVIAEYWTLVKEQFPFLLTIGINLLSALLIFIVGVFVGRRVSKRLRKSKFGGEHLDATLRPVIASIVFYIILALTIYAVLIKVGVPATALVAVFGAAGLAIGLALKDTLANIASGVMLLILRPLQVGDFVDINENTIGTVEEIGLFTSTIRNLENVAVYLPNSLVWGNRVQNYGRHARRKAIIDVGVGYDTDLDKARSVLLDVLGKQADAIPYEEDGSGAPTPPEVYVMNFGDSSIDLSCRVWLPGDSWLMRTSDLRMDMKRALDGAGIEIPFPQRVLHMAPSDDAKSED